MTEKMNVPPMISVVGKSGSGKTTLIEKLIPELRRRGHRVGIVKHAFHQFDIDKKGKDSWRHKAAGANTVIVASLGRIAMVKDHDSERLDSLECYFQDTDIVITEGYKKQDKPKIEIFRAGVHTEPLCREDNKLIAFVTDTDIDLNVPRFDLEDIQGLADLIENNYL
jgi:molybdopterin-guanine dinucleotide biosynthesis protein B